MEKEFSVDNRLNYTKHFPFLLHLLESESVQIDAKFGFGDSK